MAGSCFIAGTKVRLANGRAINIEDVKVGDILLGLDGAENVVVEFDHPLLGERLLYGLNGSHPFVTSEHPFMSSEGWASIEPGETKKEIDLDVIPLILGDKLVRYNTQELFLLQDVHENIADAETQLYNFKLDGNNTYFADDFLVHNKEGENTLRERQVGKGLLGRQVQALIDAAAEGGGELFSSDPFVRAGQITSAAIEEGTAANIESIEAAIAGLQEQFALSQGTLEPFAAAGIESLDELRNFSFGDPETAGSFDERIGAIVGGETFKNLLATRQRGAAGLLGAGGGLRGGTAITEGAQIGTETALALENQLFGRQQTQQQQEFGRLAGLTELGFGAAQGQVQGRTGLAEQIALLTGQGGAISQAGIIGGAESLSQGILASAQQAALDRNASKSRSSNLFGAVLGGALSAFSDPLLKINIKPINQIGPLVLYKWDWRPETKGTMVEHMPTIGFMSPQVKKHFPEFVFKFAGYDVIDYGGLHAHLKEAA